MRQLQAHVNFVPPFDPQDLGDLFIGATVNWLPVHSVQTRRLSRWSKPLEGSSTCNKAAQS